MTDISGEEKNFARKEACSVAIANADSTAACTQRYQLYRGAMLSGSHLGGTNPNNAAVT